MKVANRLDGPDALRPRRDAASRYGAHVGRSPTTTSGASRIKSQYKKVFVVFAPWKEQAGQRLSTAAIEGDLPIYIFACSNRLIRTVGRDGDRDRSLVGEQVPLAQQRSACAAKNL